MNLLLDTHAFLWFITNDPRLSQQARCLIQTPGNRRLLSMASLWKMAIKVSQSGQTYVGTIIRGVLFPATSIEPYRIACN